MFGTCVVCSQSLFSRSDRRTKWCSMPDAKPSCFLTESSRAANRPASSAIPRVIDSSRAANWSDRSLMLVLQTSRTLVIASGHLNQSSPRGSNLAPSKDSANNSFKRISSICSSSFSCFAQRPKPLCRSGDCDSPAVGGEIGDACDEEDAIERQGADTCQSAFRAILCLICALTAALYCIPPPHCLWPQMTTEPSNFIATNAPLFAWSDCTPLTS
mmetsp:Transcript_84884/g.162433  ORF Transcript_84884/g.162433 Transcript_84884/m.162433 type:complete len:215 (+) Transcript_84884:1604-2248(+)